MNSEIYTQNNITGEKVLYGGMSEFLSVANNYLRSDLKNIRFYSPSTNKLLRHYTINNQGIKQFIFEIPAEQMEEEEIDFEILIMNLDYEYQEDTSIFEYEADMKGETPNGEIQYWQGYPSKTQLDIPYLTANNERVINVSSFRHLSFKTTNKNYLDTLYIWQNQMEGASAIGTNIKITEFLGEGDPNAQNPLVYYDNTSNEYLKQSNIKLESYNVSPQINRSKYIMGRFFKKDNIQTWYPQIDLEPLQRYSISNTPNSGEWMQFRIHYGSLRVSLVLSMQNPAQTSGYNINTIIGNFYEIKGGDGYWDLSQIPYRYIFDKDVQSKKLKITFDIELPEEINKNEVIGIALSFERTKDGNETKKDSIMKIMIGDEEGEDKKKSDNYPNSENVVYGGIEDIWSLSNLSDNMSIDFVYGITGINKDSTTTVSIGNFNLIIFYKFHNFKDYPAFSRHDDKPYLYKKLEVSDGEVKWVAEDYNQDTKDTTPIRSRISTDVFDKLEKDKVNVHMKHKYNLASSMNTEHLFGFISSDSNRKSIVGATIDNLDVLLSDESELMSERIINHNIVDKKSKMHTSVHSGINIDKYFETCLKYLPRKVIMQVRNEDRTMERTIERESEEE